MPPKAAPKPAAKKTPAAAAKKAPAAPVKTAAKAPTGKVSAVTKKAMAAKGVTFVESAAAAESKTVKSSKTTTTTAAAKKPAAKAAAAGASSPAGRKSVSFDATAKAAGIVKPTAASPKAAKKADATPEKKAAAPKKEKAPKAKKDKKTTAKSVKAYPVLQLRYLPQAFQEPELERFLGQFGEIRSVFCARQKRTHASTGVAYVRFADDDDLPDVVEECNGMLLGGNVVRAKKVQLKRAMPHKTLVAERRFEDQKHRYRGVAIPRFDVSTKNAVASLIKQSRTEKKANATLKKLGINYSFTGFQDQLKKVPKDLFKKKAALQAERKQKKDEAKSAKKEKKVALKERAKKRAALDMRIKKGRSASIRDAVVAVPVEEDE